ncbi:MAG: amidinotransferase, partial [Alistipes sp.]|nr:amidinotransferase [Candidatus Minthomonas equi]
MQTTKVFMVKPVRFGFNNQAAGDSSFQRKGFGENIQENALREFMSAVSLLKANGVTVVMAEDTVIPHTPDSLYPRGWFSTHRDGTLVIYPMAMANRRAERKSEFIDAIRQNFSIRRVVDLTHWDVEEQYLEGTQSMVLDRDAKIAYACRSARTSEKVLADFCKQMGYSSVVFDAVDRSGNPLCHTNRMLFIGSVFALVCQDSVSSQQDREALMQSLERNSRTVVPVSMEQMEHFVTDVVELENVSGRKFLIMSGTARKSLSTEQVRILSARCRILSPELDYIENVGK